MKYNLFITKAAQEDMDDIYNYLVHELNSPLAAGKLVSKLLDRMKQLVEFPFSGEVQPNLQMLNFIYRRLIVENYVIFYTLDEQSQTATVARIIYGARRYLSILD